MLRRQKSLLWWSFLCMQEKETKTKDDKTENKTVRSEITSSPSKESPSLRLPAGLPDLNKMTPTLRLKSVFKPTVGFQCELCDQSFTTPSQLVKHNQLHEEPRSFICELCGKPFTKRTDFTEHQCSHDYSFACNMCDRSFNTSQNLKRHKLLHVKDGRKCRKCGVLFCQRHNHILYVPQTESERDSYVVEASCKDLDGDRMAGNTQWVKPEPDQTADLDDGAQSTMTITHLPTTTVQTPSSAPQTPKPLPKTYNALPPASHTRILTEIPVPVFKKPFSVPRPAPPVPRLSRTSYPANFVQPHLPQLPELPSSLRMFSPQFLTSAFLEVKRNYDYILSKPRAAKIENIVKEEPCELPLIPPSQETVVKHIKGERAAYDLEIMLWSEQWVKMYHFKQTNGEWVLYICHYGLTAPSAVMFHMSVLLILIFVIWSLKDISADTSVFDRY